jgi:quercetin dioxygenase-like cupin family protein
LRERLGAVIEWECSDSILNLTADMDNHSQLFLQQIPIKPAKTVFCRLLKYLIAQGAKMIIKRGEIPRLKTAEGIIMQVLGAGENINVLHWDMADGSIVELHQHPEEQFGYVIKGGFEMIIGDETFTIGAGDAYFIPPDTPHKFVAIGETEAIDVFNPIRTGYPQGEEVK